MIKANRNFTEKWDRTSIVLLLLIFGIIYCSISLVNHYFFRTFALDLGFYSNALYDYRNFRWNQSLTVSDYPTNMLGGHFEPVLFLLAPFSFLFGSYTLLILQILFLLWGAWCIYGYFKDSNKIIGVLASLFFLGYFSVFQALSFDFHTNVIAAACLPYLCLSIKKNQFPQFILAFIFMLFCKENISLWMFCICVGLSIEHRKNVVWRSRLLLFSFISIGYFAVVIYGIIPFFSETNGYKGFLYAAVGNSPHDALHNIIFHPIDTLKFLFVSQREEPYLQHIKIQFHLLVLLTGLPLLLFRPGYFLMLIPLYFQKMLHNQPALWGVGNHYSIEFAPVLAIGIFEVIQSVKKDPIKKALSAIIVVCSISVTFYTVNSNIMFTDRTRMAFYDKAHYSKVYDVKKVYNIFAEIPADAKISAQSVFVPHFAYRDQVYQFPRVWDAEYMILSFKESPYPLDDEVYKLATTAYFTSPEWSIWRQEDDFYVLKKHQ